MTGAKTQLEAECTAPGNVRFNENGEVIKITHKSGDFQPTFDSLKWALGAMFTNDIKFAEIVKFHRLDSNGGVIEKFLVESEDLKQTILESFPASTLEKFKEVNQNLGTTIHEYKDLTREAYFEGIRSSRKPGLRLRFEPDEEPVSLDPSLVASLSPST